MPELHISASAVIPAPAPVVYDLIADYEHGHPSILPPRFFEDLRVEKGGRGEGTRIRFTMKAFGRRQVSHAVVTEPEPGRVLVETTEGSDIETTFTVTPHGEGQTHVLLETRYPVRGVRGWIERWIVPGYLQKVYAAELQLLEQRAVESTGASAS